MNKFLRPGLRGLKAYTPGEQPRDKEYIKLNTNESPYMPGPKTLKALSLEDMEDLRLYSDPTQLKLRKKVALVYGEKAGIFLTEDNVFCSNGSDDIINFAFAAFVGREKKVIYPEISYGFYKVFAEFYGADAVEAPMKEDFALEVDAFKEKGYGLKIIANPNAPTGMTISIDEIKEILKSDREAVFLVDEAYIDFGGESAISLLGEYDNLLVSRTFSKSFSLAGARLGFALGSKEIIEALELIKYSTNPYNVNRMTDRVGLAALEEEDYYNKNCEKIAKTREETVERLEEEGFKILPSKANFIFLKTSPYISGEEAYLSLKERGILVRWFNKEEIKDYLRITIGKPEEMERLTEELIALKKQKGSGK